MARSRSVSGAVARRGPTGHGHLGPAAAGAAEHAARVSTPSRSSAACHWAARQWAARSRAARSRAARLVRAVGRTGGAGGIARPGTIGGPAATGPAASLAVAGGRIRAAGPLAANRARPGQDDAGSRSSLRRRAVLRRAAGPGTQADLADSRDRRAPGGGRRGRRMVLSQPPEPSGRPGGHGAGPCGALPPGQRRTGWDQRRRRRLSRRPDAGQPGPVLAPGQARPALGEAGLGGGGTSTGVERVGADRRGRGRVRREHGHRRAAFAQGGDHLAQRQQRKR